jgi:hypothetical protein
LDVTHCRSFPPCIENTVGIFLLGCKILLEFPYTVGIFLPRYRTLSDFSDMDDRACRKSQTSMLKTFSISPAIWSCVIRSQRRNMAMAFFAVHVSCPCFMYMPHVHAACPCCMSILHIHAACHCCCPCCMSKEHVNAACKCCFSTLHVSDG